MAPSLGIVGKLQNSIFIKVYVKERDVLFEPEKYDIYKKGGKWLKENVRDIIYQSEEWQEKETTLISRFYKTFEPAKISERGVKAFPEVSHKR